MWSAAALGLGSGAVLGLLGSGGSVLTLPILVYALHLRPKQAIAASFAVVGMSALGGLLPPIRSSQVCYKAALWFGGASAIFTALSALGAQRLTGHQQMWIFVGVVIVAAISLIYKQLRGSQVFKAAAGCDISKKRCVTSGVLVGVLAGLVGVGGGFLMVPLLNLSGLTLSLATGTSLLVVLSNSVIGVLLSGQMPSTPWPQILPFAVTASVGSYTGAVLASRIKIERLAWLLIALLVALAVALSVRLMRPT